MYLPIVRGLGSYLPSHSTLTFFLHGLVVHAYWVRQQVKEIFCSFGQNDCWHLEHRLLALQRHLRARTKTRRIFMITWIIIIQVSRGYTSKFYLLTIRYASIAFVSIQIALSPSSFNPKYAEELPFHMKVLMRKCVTCNHSHPAQSQCTPWVVETRGGAHIVMLDCKSLTLFFQLQSVPFRKYVFYYSHFLSFLT